ncbi:hypothetical protein BDZ45DRAFT_670968 [Acephala macrosclerotiorum]|nr:hypothetical protein BDZ45DRAFT_670968 [Acephala macrosclerotiorum]
MDMFVYMVYSLERLGSRWLLLDSSIEELVQYMPRQVADVFLRQRSFDIQGRGGKTLETAGFEFDYGEFDLLETSDSNDFVDSQKIAKDRFGEYVLRVYRDCVSMPAQLFYDCELNIRMNVLMFVDAMLMTMREVCRCCCTFDCRFPSKCLNVLTCSRLEWKSMSRR